MGLQRIQPLRRQLKMTSICMGIACGEHPKARIPPKYRNKHGSTWVMVVNRRVGCSAVLLTSQRSMHYTRKRYGAVLAALECKDCRPLAPTFVQQHIFVKPPFDRASEKALPLYHGRAPEIRQGLFSFQIWFSLFWYLPYVSTSSTRMASSRPALRLWKNRQNHKCMVVSSTGSSS